MAGIIDSMYEIFLICLLSAGIFFIFGFVIFTFSMIRETLKDLKDLKDLKAEKTNGSK